MNPIANLGVQMESEIRQQPELLRRLSGAYFSQLREIVSRESVDLVLLAARGSSDNAALFARYLIEIHVGIPVCMAAPSVFTKYQSKVRFSRTLAIGISQSGAAPDVSEVIETLRVQGHPTLAITNTPDSRLSRAAEKTLLLECGKELSVAATKTYSSTLLALYQLTRAMGGQLPEPSLPGDDWLEICNESARVGAGVVNRSNPIFSLARGYGFCTALETALKLMECALVPCKAYSSADFEHGPKALAGHGSAAISYIGGLPGLASQGCEVLKVTPPMSGSPEHEPISPIWDIVFGQWLSLHVARSRGLNPDQARHLSKVTETL